MRLGRVMRGLAGAALIVAATAANAAAQDSGRSTVARIGYHIPQSR